MSLNIHQSAIRLTLLAAASVLLFAGCAPSVKVRSDADPTVNMSQYETFNFFSQLGVEGEGYANLVGQHFRDIVGAEMNSRGFTKSDSPQLQVNVSIGAKDKVRVNTYNDPYLYGGYYGARGYGYYGSPFYGGGTQTTVRQYTEAQVFIDMVDSASHKMVWQGVATFTLTDKMQEEVRDTVQLTVDKVFEEFPVPAGGG